LRGAGKLFLDLKLGLDVDCASCNLRMAGAADGQHVLNVVMLNLRPIDDVVEL
jgi:hypothetical protein